MRRTRQVQYIFLAPNLYFRLSSSLSGYAYLPTFRLTATLLSDGYRSAGVPGDDSHHVFLLFSDSSSEVVYHVDLVIGLALVLQEHVVVKSLTAFIGGRELGDQGK